MKHNYININKYIDKNYITLTEKKMQREQNTIGFFSQFGKTLELFYNWTIIDYPEQKDFHYQYKNKAKNNESLLVSLKHYNYLNAYTKNMLDKKIAYYNSMDYKVKKEINSP